MARRGRLLDICRLVDNSYEGCLQMHSPLAQATLPWRSGVCGAACGDEGSFAAFKDARLLANGPVEGLATLLQVVPLGAAYRALVGSTGLSPR